jgi:quinohemoprotein ethanol dehydrogenase
LVRGAALALIAGPALSATAYAATGPTAGNVDTERLQQADHEPQNWVTGGRDKDGTYFSPLTTIDAGNVKQLGFAWSYDLGEPQRGQEATPLVIDGVMYTSGTWGYVYAVDAASGKELWRYDPKADFFMGRNPCCDLVNRGVAVWSGKVFVASVDGRLHALDAATGKKIWEADTIVDRKLPYSSTGAPQIAGGVVVIGNSGADMGHGAVRGYISAYDLQTGALKWRFFTVPPAVGQPYENPELAAADKTWDPHRKPEPRWERVFYSGHTKERRILLRHLWFRRRRYLRSCDQRGWLRDRLVFQGLVLNECIFYKNLFLQL